MILMRSNWEYQRKYASENKNTFKIINFYDMLYNISKFSPLLMPLEGEVREKTKL